MKNNMVLFEGVVMDSWKSNSTTPPSEVINLNYPLDPIDIIDVTYNEETGEIEETLSGISDKGWIQITLPNFNGLKTGDKIRVIKYD